MFTIVSTVVFILLMLVWSTKTWVNFFMKFGFLTLGVWGLYLIFSNRMFG